MRLHLDDAGDPTAVSGQSYSPFGVPQSGSLPQPFGFTGELHLGGLQYLRARWYDPAAGVFVGRDPFAGDERDTFNEWKLWLRDYFNNIVVPSAKRGEEAPPMQLWIEDRSQCYHHDGRLDNGCICTFGWWEEYATGANWPGIDDLRRANEDFFRKIDKGTYWQFYGAMPWSGYDRNEAFGSDITDFKYPEPGSTP